MTDESTTPNPTQLRYLDDLRPGERFTSGACAISVAEIQAFARRFDPQLVHLDEELARAGFFGGLAASGWHVAAVTMRLLVDGGLPFGGGMIGIENHIKWPRPTRPGDVLHVESEILEVSPSRSRPDRGVVEVRSRTLNQRGEEVQSMESKILVFRKPGFSSSVGSRS